MRIKNQTRQYIQLECKECHIVFRKEKKEIERQTRLGKECKFCSRKCSVICTRRPDADEPFRFTIRQCKRSARLRNYQFNLDWEYLKELWNLQGGKCVYTGINLVLPDYRHISSPRKASIDRIDSSEGYIKGNVEWVSVFINLGKNGFSKLDIQEILMEYKNNLNT